MKWVHITFRQEFSEAVGYILERHGIRDYVLYPMVQGRDADGKHEGGKIFPGSMAVVQALVEDDETEIFMEELLSFRDEKPSHGHLRAVVVGVEKSL